MVLELAAKKNHSENGSQGGLKPNWCLTESEGDLCVWGTSRGRGAPKTLPSFRAGLVTYEYT